MMRGGESHRAPAPVLSLRYNKMGAAGIFRYASLYALAQSRK